MKRPVSLVAHTILTFCNGSSQLLNKHEDVMEKTGTTKQSVKNRKREDGHLTRVCIRLPETDRRRNYFWLLK